MTYHRFIDSIRSLYNIDRAQLPELTDSQWPEFRDDPPRFLIHAEPRLATAIMREVEQRQPGNFW